MNRERKSWRTNLVGAGRSRSVGRGSIQTQLPHRFSTRSTHQPLNQGARQIATMVVRGCGPLESASPAPYGP